MLSRIKRICFLLLLTLVIFLPTGLVNVSPSQAAGFSVFEDRIPTVSISIDMSGWIECYQSWQPGITRAIGRTISDRFQSTSLAVQLDRLLSFLYQIVNWLLGLWEAALNPGNDNDTGDSESTQDTADADSQDTPPPIPSNDTDTPAPPAANSGNDDPVADSGSPPGYEDIESNEETNSDADHGPSVTVYEDAEDGLTDGWQVYTGDPAKARIANILDATRNDRAIVFEGENLNHGFALFNRDGSVWDNEDQFVAVWHLNFSEPFVVYIEVWTSAGRRYLQYSPVDYDDLGSESNVHHGIGSHTIDGSWHVIARDLTADLRDAQPDATLLAVNGFLVRGSGMIDNIQLMSDSDDWDGDGLTDIAETNTYNTDPYSIDTDADGLGDADEIQVYGTDPTRVDSDGDGINDREELDYWDTRWDADTDSDGLINLLDPDSDDDGVKDGVEIDAETDPADDSKTLPTIYEDAEDGLTAGWLVYAGDPTGARFENVIDAERNGRVIELTGNGQEHGFALYGRNGLAWQNERQQIVEFSLKYAEFFTVYVEVMTSVGRRYLQYTPVDYDNLGDASLVHHGLGSDKADGRWQRFSRDLQLDLNDAQPGIDIYQVDGFLVRGSGRVDDIKLWSISPDSDGDGLTDLLEMTVYDTHPDRSDTDGDGLNDADEVMIYGTAVNAADTDNDNISDSAEAHYWGATWNADIDNDGLINLLDPDSDDDGVPDGDEIHGFGNPADPSY